MQCIGLRACFVFNGALRFVTESPMPETTVELIQTGPEESELIRNLYQYYAYESSDWEQEDVEADGRFYIHDEHLIRYWQDPQWSANLLLALYLRDYLPGGLSWLALASALAALCWPSKACSFR